MMSSTEFNSDVYLKLFELLGVLARQRQRYSEPYLLKFGLNPTEAHLLTLVVQQKGPVSQDELAKYIYIDRTNVGRSLKRLEQQGHVRRLKDESDRRANLVIATANAKKMAVALRTIRVEIAHDFFGHLSRKETDALMNSIKKLVENEELS